jgi:hypothetical protein
MTNEGPETTIGGFDTAGRWIVLGLFGAVGAALGALLPVVARWVSELPWAPFQGPLELIGSFDQAWLTWGRPGIGLVAGLLFAAWTIADSPVLDVDATHVRVRRGGKVERVLERTKVDSVHRHRGKVVIESAQGRTLFEGDVEGDRSAIRDAFVSHGYPWEGPED